MNKESFLLLAVALFTVCGLLFNYEIWNFKNTTDISAKIDLVPELVKCGVLLSFSASFVVFMVILKLKK
ncbi:MAG: hypothetical protein AAB628_02375 [Patescibacteria group bacterium]